jgi:4-amino-4-deoxy-L-arabinose transferase-like glycosyltransferase
VIKLLQRQGLAAAVVVGLIARVALTSVLFSWRSIPTHGDDASYIHFAQVILQTGAPESHHLPLGYPIFLAAILELGGGSFVVVRAANVLLGLITIVVVSRIAGILYGDRAKVMAAWLTALYPPLVYMTGRVMSETLFIALLMLALERFLVADRGRRLRDYALAGGLFGLASLVRSNLLLLLAFIPLWQLGPWPLHRPLQETLRSRLVPAVLSGAVAACILCLPGLYFLKTTGQFVPTATNAGQTFYGANNPLADGGWVEVEEHPELLQSIPPDLRAAARGSPVAPPQLAAAVAYSRLQTRLATRWIEEHPGAFLKLLPKKFANAWLPGVQQSETTSGSKIASLVQALSAGLLLGGAIGGRLRAGLRQRDGLLIAVLATYTIMSLAFYGNPRIGLFCAPILIVYCASLFGSLRVFEAIPPAKDPPPPGRQGDAEPCRDGL